ncbi:MAG: type II toxin-antitoxin system VapC family toxin [Xanthobacteraceae bacterium]|nr:type II toxin-antitoxin system VapC family toxin [Xanthobacteraceae bacterium]
MILVDTSVWVKHLRAGDAALVAQLHAGMVLAHPFVIGELALGNLRQRDVVLTALADLPHASVATDAEVLHFIERHALFGRGIGYVDAHLLAAVRLTAGAELWTNDKRLYGVAFQLGLAMTLPRSRRS